MVNKGKAKPVEDWMRLPGPVTTVLPNATLPGDTYVCSRPGCGHVWQTRLTGRKPVRCPRCSSVKWEAAPVAAVASSKEDSNID